MCGVDGEWLTGVELFVLLPGASPFGVDTADVLFVLLGASPFGVETADELVVLPGASPFGVETAAVLVGAGVGVRLLL